MPQSPHGRWAKWYASVARDKAAYSDRLLAAYATLVALAADCEGVFDSEAHVAALLANRGGKRTVAALVEAEDLVVTPSGKVRLAGWDVYQGRREPAGASTERVRRYRDKKAREAVGETLGNGVTEPFLSHSTFHVTDDGGEETTKENAVPPARVREARPGDVDDGRDDPELPVLSWLAGEGAYVPPTGNGYHRTIAGLVERHGVPKVIAAMEAASERGASTARQYVFAATNLLDAVPSMTDVAKDAARAEREAAAVAASRRASEATRRRIAELRPDEDDDGLDPYVSDRRTPTSAGARLRPTAGGSA